jgi:5'-nucleotidase
VTNDDGIDAAGLRVLAEKLREAGKVTVVAPAREMSAVSHALTIHEPLRFEHVGERSFKVEGTPADCVNLAVVKLFPKPPDVVVSGINRGANVGDDIAYSGTVAGAREAAMLGVPSMAVSLASKDPSADYSHAAAFAAQVLPVLARQKEWSRRTFLNVNVPDAKVKGVRVTSQGRRPSWTKVEEKIDRLPHLLLGQAGLHQGGAGIDLRHLRGPGRLHLDHAAPVRFHRVQRSRGARVVGPAIQRQPLTGIGPSPIPM